MSVAPVLQTNWDWRAAGNFIGGGTGAGLIIVSTVLILNGYKFYGLVLASVLFIATGLFLVWLEIGKPLRFLNVYLKPFTSWMSRESYLATALVPAGLAAFWFQSGSLLIIAMLLAGFFLYSQARILKAARGIRAWRTPEIVPVIMSTALVEGTGALFIALPLFYMRPDMFHPVKVFVFSVPLILLRLWAWYRYRNALAHDAPEGTRLALVSAHRPFLIYGHILPAGLLAASAVLSVNGYTTAITLFSGLCMLISGWFIKYIIVTRAAYNQGYALAHSPARGAGTSGEGVKPGWIIQ